MAPGTRRTRAGLPQDVRGRRRDSGLSRETSREKVHEPLLVRQRGGNFRMASSLPIFPVGWERMVYCLGRGNAYVPFLLGWSSSLAQGRLRRRWGLRPRFAVNQTERTYALGLRRRLHFVSTFPHFFFSFSLCVLDSFCLEIGLLAVFHLSQ